jgi:hypothetical protein
MIACMPETAAGNLYFVAMQTEDMSNNKKQEIMTKTAASMMLIHVKTHYQTIIS